MRSLRMPLVTLLLASCADGTAAGDGFEDFWVDFRTAVAADDPSTVQGLTRFPFLFEGEEIDPSGFPAVYEALFASPERNCLATTTPTPEDDRYFAFCGAIVYLFERGEGGWRFAEFTADPEALGDEDLDPTGVGESDLGSWQVADGRAGPWSAQGDRRLTNSELAGTRVRFGAGQVQGNHPLGCLNAEYEFVVSPAEGLFQGGLPEPAATSARDLGITRIPALTLRVRCDGGSFDYHHVPGDTLLTALDGVVWRLAPDLPHVSPAAVVRSLLAEHMTGSMAFTRERVAQKRTILSAPLAAAIASYLERPHPDDEAPPINGDPFTDSQDHPDRFTLEVLQAAADHAAVRVVFSDGFRSRPVDFLLVREGGDWRLDDLRYEDGSTFREQLQE